MMRWITAKMPWLLPSIAILVLSTSTQGCPQLVELLENDAEIVRPGSGDPR